MRKFEKYLGSMFLKFLRLTMPPSELSPASFDPALIKNILVILRHRMGDTVLAFPMLAALRENFAGAYITLVTKASTNYRQIFTDKNPYCDEIREYEYGFDNFVELISDLRKRTYELAVVPSTVSFSVTNHLIAYYSKAKYRVGVESFSYMENPSAFVLNIKNDFHWKAKKVHQIRRYLDVISQLGISPHDTRIHFPLAPQRTSIAAKFLSDNFPESSRMVIAVHPGAGRLDNVWNPQNYAMLVLSLKEKFNPNFLISEGPADAEYVRNLLNLLKQYSISEVAVHKGALLDNLALIALCGLFVTNDTGIMHLASGLDVPMVSLFGPSDASEWAPIGKNKVAIQSSTRNINDIKLERVLEVCTGIISNHIKSG